ncbi:GIY-YIG nuclease family protein [Parvibaculum sp.]|uniref:GIY-YIG nuclease family protein n=1 Tax=Parvibaculum sp. TaxID=2024848 RepID=UPI000C44C641|nr:hypothetical protein [Parvibaculum sp.]HCX67465.1 hypothetical protein [Rhodobiaceae bacterium]
MNYYVYILASRKHGTLYVGVTNDIARRVDEHRLGSASSFTRKYAPHRTQQSRVGRPACFAQSLTK